LTWNTSAGATSYKVKRATINGGPYPNTNILTGLTFTNTGLLNGTPYYYVVSAVNSLGESANSSQVSSTPTNLPPILATISNQTILAGRTLVVTNSASDVDGPPPLAYRLVAAPAGASINTNSGLVTWRPAIAQSPGNHSVIVAVSDAGVPVMSATQSLWVTANQPVTPVLGLSQFTNQTLRFLVSGDAGPDYSVQMSTNLNGGGSWVNYFTTNSPALPFNFVAPVDTTVPQQYYRIQLGP
jgi:cellulose 1,4-beta-cellobiosidase